MKSEGEEVMNGQTQHAAVPFQTVSDKIWTRDFFFVCFANFFIFLGLQMTLPTIPLYIEELGASNQLIGFIFGIFTVSAVIVRPWAGHALETKGRRLIFLSGLAIFVFSVSSYAFSTLLFVLFLMRMVQGAGWGLSTTAGGTVATDLIPIHRRGEGMGYFGLTGSLAMAFGPAFGLTLASLLGFPKMFLTAAFLGIVSFTLASLIHYRPVDHAKEIEKRKWDFYEKTSLFPASLIFFNSIAFGAVTTFLPMYTQEKDIPGIEWFFVAFAISMMLSRPFAGRIYDRIGHTAIFIPGTILIIGSMLFLAFLAFQWMLIASAICYGLGWGAIHPAIQAWTVNRAPGHRKGMANATFFSSIDLGIGFGAMFFGVISESLGFISIYALSALACCISLMLYLAALIRKNRRRLANL